jgi:hypothetical protein
MENAASHRLPEIALIWRKKTATDSSNDREWMPEKFLNARLLLLSLLDRK